VLKPGTDECFAEYGMEMRAEQTRVLYENISNLHD
jgi:hypothetical protein